MLGSNLRAILPIDTLQNGRLVFLVFLFLLQASFMAKKTQRLIDSFAKTNKLTNKNNLLSVDR
jgi:hypothetical protein